MAAAAPATAGTPATSSAAALAQRSVAPSAFAALLGEHLSTSSSPSAEQRATLELCFKLQMQTALQRWQSSVGGGDTAAAAAAVPLDSPHSEVCALLDASLWCKLEGLVEVTTPLVLVEDAVESVPLASAERLFVQLLVPRVRLLIRTEDGQRAKLLFIRLCNNLLRRLSKTTNTNFAGQISLQISSACPVDERSAINLLGKFNRENVTIAESLAPAESEATAATTRNNSEVKMEDDSDASGGGATTVAASASAPSVSTPTATLPPVSLAALPPPPMASTASTNGNGSSQSAALDSALYTALWGVQPFLLDPQSLRATPQLESFRACVVRILDCFDSRSLNEKDSLASIVSSSSGAGAAFSSVFPKYLTGSRLLGLQLRDPMFRRHLLLQLLIFIAHILNPLGNIEVMREIFLPQPATTTTTTANAAASAAAAAAAQQSQLTQTTLSGAFLPVAELVSLRLLFSRALRLLKLTPPGSLKFTESFLALLGRENRFWISWKDSKCPPIERAPVAAAVMDATIDVEALAQALRDKRAAAANPAAAGKEAGATPVPAADSSARKRKAGVLGGGGGGPFRGFAKSSAPLPSLSSTPLTAPGGRLYMGSANLAKLFAPSDERNQDALGFLQSEERRYTPDARFAFIQPMLFEEEEARERDEARKQRHAERDAKKAKVKAEKEAARAKAKEEKEAKDKADKEAAAAAVKDESDVSATTVKQEDGAKTEVDASMADVDADADEEEEDGGEVDEEDAADAAADGDMMKHETRKVWQLLRLLASTPAVVPAWLEGAVDEEQMESSPVSGLDLFVRSEGSAQKLLDYFAADKKKRMAGAATAAAAGAIDEELAVDEAAVLALQVASTSADAASAPLATDAPTPPPPAQVDATMAAAADAASPVPAASPIAASEGAAASPISEPVTPAAATPTTADDSTAIPAAAAASPSEDDAAVAAAGAEEDESAHPRKKIKRESLGEDAAVSAAIDAAAAAATTEVVKSEPSAPGEMDTATFPYIWTRNSVFLKVTFICSLIFLVAGSLGDLVIPVTLKYAIDMMTPPDPEFPVYPILLYGLASFMSSAFDQLRDVFFSYVSANTERLVALETFEHLQSLSLGFHLQRETGSVLRSVSRGASSFAGLLRIVLFQILPVFVQVLVVCVFLFIRYPWYFGLVTGGVIILYFTFTLTTTDWRDKYRRVMNLKDNEFNQKATDALLNYETVKYFNAEQHEEARYDQALREYSHANMRSQQTLAVLNAGQQLIITCGVVGCMVLAANLVVHDKLKIGDYVMLYQFILTLYQPLGFLGTYYRMIKQSMVDVESMVTLWQEKPDITDRPDATLLQLYHAAPEIKFDKVCFAYPNGIPILKNISFTVPPGKKIAVVGPSGAGKSTLARLLYRFYEVSSGRILIDGQDIAGVTQRSLREEIAIVPQDTVLFNDTLGYNIGYGAFAKNPGGATQAQIEDAAKSAQLDAFIARQPQGYGTQVGERGLRLSGGERQRVSIARAMLKKPAVMVFDEATSSLDTHTEAAIQSAIHTVAAGRTTVTIAHRLSTIMHSDVILVMDRGSVVEQGTHEELLQRKGLYAQMWARQQKTLELQQDLQRLQTEEQAQTDAQKADAEAALAAAKQREGILSIRVDGQTERKHDDPPASAPPAAASSSSFSSIAMGRTVAPAPALSVQSDYMAAVSAVRAASPPPVDHSASAVAPPPIALEESHGAVSPSSPASPSLRDVRRQMQAKMHRVGAADSALHEPLLSNDESDS